MTDDDRIRLAIRQGSHWIGPTERERCQKHRRRWVMYRWVWEVDGEISGGDVQVVRSCAACMEEDEL